MTQNSRPRKISAPARIGNSYELRLFALSCLKTISDRSIEHVWHEDSSAAPVDDVIIEFQDRIECYQAKHAINPHALLEIKFDTAELIDPATDFTISFARLAKAWQSLQSRGKEVTIVIFTNRAAESELSSLLEENYFKDAFVSNNFQKRKRKKLCDKIRKEIAISDDELISFLSSIRYDLRQPNEAGLNEVIRSDWLERKFGLNAASVYDRFVSQVERWFLESRTRPIDREEVLAALQLNNSNLPQIFPVNPETYVDRADFEQDVERVLFRDRGGYTAIVGTPGSGKSTFITQFTDKLRERGQPLVRYYAFTQVNDTFQRERVGKEAFLKSIIEQLYAEFHDLVPDERRYNYSEQRLLQLLTLLGEHFQAKQQQLLMVVDGIDHVGREVGIEETQKLLNVLPKQLPVGVVCAIGTQSTQYLPVEIERQCREDTLLNIPLFKIEQTQDFLSRCFEESSRPNDRTIDSIHKRSEGLPLYLHFIAERLKQAAIEEYDNLVAILPAHEGHIDRYYAALWSEFSKEPKLKKLCGLSARLHFRVKTSDLLSMAGMTDAFESEPPFDRMKHLLQVSELGCRVFHNSFRGFINTELSPDQLQQLDKSILRSYLDSRRNELLWFMYAHRYADAAKDCSYLIANYGQDYVLAAIRRGRPRHEIMEALKATARAAISECNLVVTAQTAALVSHTQGRLEYDIDRAQLWRSMLSMGEIDDALAAFSQEQEVYDLSAETARIIVYLVERGKYEFGRILAKDFINRLPKDFKKDVDLSIAVGELVSVYASNPAEVLARWIGTKTNGEGISLYSQVDLGTALLPKALKNLYKFGRWDVLSELEKLLPKQVGWVDREDIYSLEIIKLETEFRPDKVQNLIRHAVSKIKNRDERILLAGHLARHDLGIDIANKLLDGVILHPQLKYEKSWQAPKPKEFQVFRAYVAGLEYLGRSTELQVLSNFLHTSDSSIAAYYQICFTVARSNDRPDQLLAGLTRLGDYQSHRGERVVEIQESVRFDRSAFLTELVGRYLAGGGEVKLLIDRFRYACEGKTFPIPKLMGLELLSTFSGVRSHLQDLIAEIHDLIFNAEFETQSRMNDLLSLADIASRCGHLSLGRKWQEEAVLAARGYGYRKDPTIGLLIEALEEINSLQPELLQQRVADIAEWNLFMPKVTENGKGIRWFPISLFKVAFSCNPEIGRGLLLPYRNYIYEWQFSDSLTSFLCSYEGDRLLLAYTLSEIINEKDGRSESSYKDKFDARFHLLQVAVERGDRIATRWLDRHIRQFILTEVNPAERFSFTEEYNKYIATVGDLLPINLESARPIDLRKSNDIDIDLPDRVEVDGEEILKNSLVLKISLSFEIFSRNIEHLIEKYGNYKLRLTIQQSLDILLQKARSISDLDRIADLLDNNREVAESGYSLLAGRYLSLGSPDRAAKYYRSAFLLDNKFELWNPNMNDFRRLAEIDPKLAFDTLFDFVDRHLEEHDWGGETIFLLFLKGALVLGETHHCSAIDLYDAFHKFIKTQFAHLPNTESSPYQWLREPNYQIESFEEISKKLIEQAWSEPLLHRRHHLVHLLKDLEIDRPDSIVPWLVELLRHDDHTLNTQSALVLAGISLDRSDLLTEYVNELMAALDPPHAEKCYYLKQSLAAIAENHEAGSRIIDRLKSLRPRIAGTSLIILPDTLRPSLDFKTKTISRIARTIHKTISTVCELLDLELDWLYWKIEQEIERMGFDGEIAQQEFDRRGKTYCYEKDCIPFETYDDYYVWHGFNRVLERELRENVVDPAILMAIDSLVRLYDPRFPLSEIELKPIDLNLPPIDKDLRSKELSEEIRAWINFDGEELLKERQLEGDWITIFDKYNLESDRILEKRFATSFLASDALADKIIGGEKIVKWGEAVLQLAPEPPYYSLTHDEARSGLDRCQALASIDRSVSIPLIALHSGHWWHFTRSSIVSISGGWIQHYGLSWDTDRGLNLSFNGKPAQKVLTWSDGFEVSYGRRKQVGHGTRLLLSRNFLETLMQDYSLCLVVTSWSKRLVYGAADRRDRQIESENERESVSIYRSNH
jgi:GTPase SAR1 family protein